ncbi:MAG: helicase-exonuclease AddAB subunit AddB [Peptostreptococcaceae bacterium]
MNFVLGRSGSGKSEFLLNEIKKQVKTDQKTPVIWLVPEQYTFEAEKKLSEIFMGEEKDKFLRSRVLSMKTLDNIILSIVGGLSKTQINTSGKSMMIKKSIENIENRKEILNIFSSNQNNLIESILDTISELKQFNISSQDLIKSYETISDETLKLKISDIIKIYTEYELLLQKDDYIDSQDSLKTLAFNLENCDYLNDSYVYIDEFTGFTPSQYNVIKVILKKAKKVMISLTVDSIDNLEYKITDPFSRTKITYEKISMICRENDIKFEQPIFLDKSLRLKNEELIYLEQNINKYKISPYTKKTEHIKINQMNNYYQEVEEVAKSIVKLVRDKNIRYKEITVSSRDIEKYEFLINSIFEEYEIPNFIDVKKEAKSNPIIVLIISLLEMKSKSYSYETMFRYLKSGLLNIDDDEVNILENYVLETGIRGNKKWFDIEDWNYKKDFYDEDLLVKINSIRRKVISPINNFHTKVKGRNTVEQICRHIYDFLIEININETIENLVRSFEEKGELDTASKYKQVFDIVIDILDQMVEIMKDEKISFDKFINLINLGFDSYELSVVPPSIDEVLVSSVDRMKNANTKYLFLIGVNDGVFPLASKENGILNDSDREKLFNNGIEMNVDTRVKTFEEQYLVYKALTYGSDNLIISYPVADSEGKTLRPSIIISKLKKLFINIEFNTFENNNKKKTTEGILDELISKKLAFNDLIFELNKNKDDVNEVYFDIYRYFMENEDYKDFARRIDESLNYTNMVDILSEERASKLYQNVNLSVSKIESFSNCAFAYFIRYGLGAKKRNEYGFSSLDLGNFVHNVVEDFSNNLEFKKEVTWKNLDKKYIENEVSKIVTEKIDSMPGFILSSSAKYRYLSNRIKNMIVFVISVLAKQIQSGEFEPVSYEFEFSGDTSIKIKDYNGDEINLVGKIDRIDKYSEGNSDFYRIVDYKSSKKNISLSEVYYGLQLQLLVYMDSILKDDNSHPAGMFYSRIDEIMVNAKNPNEEVEDSLLQALKFSGLAIKDLEIVKKMDRSFEEEKKVTSKVIPVSTKKDGDFTSSTNAITKTEFEIIRSFGKKVIKDVHRDIYEGKISINPYKAGDKDSCKFCDFSFVCQFDESLENNIFRSNKKLKDVDVINKMKEELDK